MEKIYLIFVLMMAAAFGAGCVVDATGVNAEMAGDLPAVSQVQDDPANHTFYFSGDYTSDCTYFDGAYQRALLSPHFKYGDFYKITVYADSKCEISILSKTYSITYEYTNSLTDLKAGRYVVKFLMAPVRAKPDASQAAELRMVFEDDVTMRFEPVPNGAATSELLYETMLGLGTFHCKPGNRGQAYTYGCDHSKAQ